MFRHAYAIFSLIEWQNMSFKTVVRFIQYLSLLLILRSYENVSHENDLIFMRMNEQVTYI